MADESRDPADAEPALSVIRGSPQVTVQDSGRVGLLHSGMPVSGAQDYLALRIGNLLLGNQVGGPYGVAREPGDAGLEILLPGFELEAITDCYVAITGGDLGAEVDGQAAPLWESFQLREGDRLKFRRVVSGMRAYLAIHGGVAVEPVLGSRATYLRGSIGGHNGTTLAPGDVVSRYRPRESVSPQRIKTGRRPQYAFESIRVTFGPQDHLYTDEAKHLFVSQPWRMLPESDRMGFRFSGPILTFRDWEGPPEYTAPFIVDDFIPIGGIQTPSDGLIIVMGVEGPSIGGYAKIATVVSSDFGVLGQLKPGTMVHFVAVAWDEAIDDASRVESMLHDPDLLEEVP